MLFSWISSFYPDVAQNNGHNLGPSYYNQESIQSHLLNSGRAECQNVGDYTFNTTDHHGKCLRTTSILFYCQLSLSQMVRYSEAFSILLHACDTFCPGGVASRFFLRIIRWSYDYWKWIIGGHHDAKRNL